MNRPIAKEGLTEQWVVTLSSGEKKPFHEWEPCRKYLFDQDVDMSDYPCEVTLFLMDGEKVAVEGKSVDIVTFQAIYVSGLVDGRHEKPYDDDCTATHSWLLSIGFVRDNGEQAWTIGFTNADGEEDLLLFYRDSRATIGKRSAPILAKTRGDVRRLCKLVGVELKDGKTSVPPASQGILRGKDA